MNSYELSEDALRDLNAILYYIEDRTGVAAAADLQDEILASCERIAGTPGLGHRRFDLTKRSMLFYLVGAYYIVYTPGTDPLSVIGIFHSKRELRRLLLSR